MRRRSSLRGGALAVFVLAATACASSGGGGSQLGFGVDMARRGLWNEALFRFEQARRESPGDVRVLNNLAVAYEAVGRFDDALATYKEAAKVGPGERALKVNYSRFLEFYQSYRRKPAGPAAAPTPTGGGAP